MSTIAELEKQLQEAKEKEKREALEKECQTLKEQYEGKVFGNRNFERASKTASDILIYVHKLYIGKSSFNYNPEDKILVDIWTIRVCKYNTNYRIDKDVYDYRRSRSTALELTGNNYNASYNLTNLFPHNPKEVKLSKFMAIWEAAEKHESILIDSFKQHLGGYEDLIKDGDHTDESNIQKAIDSLGLEIIDIRKEHPLLWDTIKYAKLPMFQNQRWIPKIFGSKLLTYWIEQLKKQLHSPFMDSSRASRITKEIKIIHDHLIYFQ